MINFTTIALPHWATTNEAKAWFYGFAVMALVRLVRASLRWFKAVAMERYE